MRWRIVFEELPMAMSTMTAFSKASSVRTLLGVRSSLNSSITLMPVYLASSLLLP